MVFKSRWEIRLTMKKITLFPAHLRMETRGVCQVLGDFNVLLVFGLSIFASASRL